MSVEVESHGVSYVTGFHKTDFLRKYEQSNSKSFMKDFSYIDNFLIQKWTYHLGQMQI